MSLFNISFSTLLVRFYLLMAVIIVAGFSGIWSIAFLSLPVFMSCLLGISFSWDRAKEQAPIGQIRQHLHLTSDRNVQSAA